VLLLKHSSYVICSFQHKKLVNIYFTNYAAQLSELCFGVIIKHEYNKVIC